MSQTTTEEPSSTHLNTFEQPPSIPATLGRLRYVPAGHIPEPSPHNYHLPAISEFSDIRVLPLHSMIPLPTVDGLDGAKDHAQLHTHGFTALRHPTALHSMPYTLSSWKDPVLLSKHYIYDTAAMLKTITGCKTVITEALLLRSALWTESDALATHAAHSNQESDTSNSYLELETGFPSFIGFNPSSGGVSPAPKPHLDYSPAGARVHIREYHPLLTAAAEDIISTEDSILAANPSVPLAEIYSTTPGAKRWAMHSIWRPLKTVRRDTLALLDQRSMSEGDYIPVGIKTPCLGRPGGEQNKSHVAEGYVARYSEGHRWFWIDEQKPEEVLIIGLFDSDMEAKGWKGAGGTLHSSVELLEQGDHIEARESLELRCLCIW
ncbi:hypothetical protein V8F20_008904 [Naviculisporaceae sp. PSN 640]